MSKREDIIKELKRRLLLKIPSVSTIVEGTGGIWGSWDRKIPCLHLFELPTKKTLVKPGVYLVELPIQIEYINRLAKQDACFTEGRAKIIMLQTGIELDERFTKNKNLVTAAEDLVIEYSCVADEIATPLPNVLDAAVLYVFKFTDVFYGYEDKRH